MSPEVLLAVHCLLSACASVCGNLTTNHDHCARPMAPVAATACGTNSSSGSTPTAAPTPAACPVDALDLADSHVVVVVLVVVIVGAANVTLTVNYEYLRNFLIKIANVPR